MQTEYITITTQAIIILILWGLYTINIQKHKEESKENKQMKWALRVVTKNTKVLSENLLNCGASEAQTRSKF